MFLTSPLMVPIPGSVGAADLPGPDPEGPVETTTEFDWDATYKEFAATEHITTEEARRAFSDSRPLYDFVLANKDDARFGAVWVTYDQGYQIHARYLEPSFSRLVDLLEREVGAKIYRHKGGASHIDLMHAIDVARNETSAPEFELNHPLGTIDFSADEKVDVDRYINPAFARSVVFADEEIRLQAAGTDFEYKSGGIWSDECTVGFEWGSSNWRGFATAGHCADPNNGTGRVNGLLTSNPGMTFLEHCSPQGGDYQHQEFAQPYNLSEYGWDKRTYPHPLIAFEIAGGYYTGQPTLKSGLWANGSIGSNVGTVQGFGSHEFPAGGDCWWGGGTWSALRYNNLSNGGDSGGPIFLSYGGSWFLAATHVAGPQLGSPGSRYGMWVPWITLPSGTHICRVSNPCN